MHLPTLTFSLTLLAILASPTLAARKPSSSDAILLSNVKTLTQRKDLSTTHNRVSAVPQLSCVGGNACKHYEIDVLRCKNQGADYDVENIQWTCTANLPDEFKLGTTDVICEGFASSEDPYVLKGSCGVEYRLLLTEKGEEKFGTGWRDTWSGRKVSSGTNWPALLFWALFIAVVGWMIYAAFIKDRTSDTGRLTGGSGGGGGGGGGGYGDDPPPPYTSSPYSKGSSSRSYAAPPPAPVQQGWRPGFWTGAAGGGAAGYFAGSRAQQRREQGWGVNNVTFGNYNGEGSSGWGGGRAGRPSSSSSSFSNTRHESSGFGGTSRR